MWSKTSIVESTILRSKISRIPPRIISPFCSNSSADTFPLHVSPKERFPSQSWKSSKVVKKGKIVNTRDQKTWLPQSETERDAIRNIRGQKQNKGRSKSARKEFKKYEKFGDIKSAVNYIKAVGIEKGWRASVDLLDEILKKTWRLSDIEKIFTAVGKICSDAARNSADNKAGSAVLELWHEATSEYNIRSIRLCNSMMSALAGSRRTDDALAIWETAKTLNIKPEATTYNILLNACARSGRLGDAKRFFIELHSTNRASLKPSHVCYASMLFVYIKAGYYEDAKTFFNWLDEEGTTACKPDAITLSMMLNCAVDNEDTELAERLIHRIRTNLFETSGFFAAYLKFLGPDKWREVVSVVDELIERKIEAGDPYLVALNICRNAGQTETVIQIIDKALTNSFVVLRPHHVTEGMIALHQVGDFDGSLSLYRRCLETGSVKGLENDKVVERIFQKALNCE